MRRMKGAMDQAVPDTDDLRAHEDPERHVAPWNLAALIVRHRANAVS